MSLILSGTDGLSDVDGSAATPAIRGTDANTGIFFPAADTIAFSEGGTESMRLDSNGNVGIGTSSPGHRLHVANSSATSTTLLANILARIQSNASGADASFQFSDNVTNSAGISLNQGNLIFSIAGGTVGRFDANGNFAIPPSYNHTTGSAANVFIRSDGYLQRSTSSLKYKRDIENTTHGLAEVMQLRAVTYKGKAEGDGDTVFGGLIAEEVHDAGLTEFVQYADDGTPDALAYGNMVSLCIKAIQEQQQMIETLQAKVAALEAK